MPGLEPDSAPDSAEEPTEAFALPPFRVDAHLHVFPDTLGLMRAHPKLKGFRKRARRWYRPFAASFHRIQTVLRHLPEPARIGLENLTSIAPLPSLIWEGNLEDLQEAMDACGLNYGVLIAHPPVISNEAVLELARLDPRLIPVVNIQPGSSRPGQMLKKYALRGAKGVKIHPAADGEGVDSPRYKAVLRAARELSLPVILHTGCFHSRLFFKKPELGRAGLYAPWFESHPEMPFILAHMNMDDPQVALDLAAAYPNVHVDTSWQPAEIIGEAVRRIGAEKVLFGSDWPIVGDNISVGLKRVAEAIESGALNDEQAELILGGNATRIFRLEPHAPAAP